LIYTDRPGSGGLVSDSLPLPIAVIIRCDEIARPGINEPQINKMKIKVIADDGDGETYLTLDSDDLGFNLHDMAVGENRSIANKEGR